jgi:hypothetical protein
VDATSTINKSTHRNRIGILISHVPWGIGVLTRR